MFIKTAWFWKLVWKKAFLLGADKCWKISGKMSKLFSSGLWKLDSTCPWKKLRESISFETFIIHRKFSKEEWKFLALLLKNLWRVVETAFNVSIGTFRGKVGLKKVWFVSRFADLEGKIFVFPLKFFKQCCQHRNPFVHSEVLRKILLEKFCIFFHDLLKLIESVSAFYRKFFSVSIPIAF